MGLLGIPSLLLGPHTALIMAEQGAILFMVLCVFIVNTLNMSRYLYQVYVLSVPTSAQLL